MEINLNNISFAVCKKEFFQGSLQKEVISYQVYGSYFCEVMNNNYIRVFFDAGWRKKEFEIDWNNHKKFKFRDFPLTEFLEYFESNKKIDTLIRRNKLLKLNEL